MQIMVRDAYAFGDDGEEEYDGPSKSEVALHFRLAGAVVLFLAVVTESVGISDHDLHVCIAPLKKS